MNNNDLIINERNRFPVLNTKSYLATASTGIIPDYIYNAVEEYQANRYFYGGDSDWDGMDSWEMIDRCRQPIAEMMGAEADDIAFGDNSSRMLNIFIQGVKLEPSDNIIISEDAFFSNKFAWQMREKDGIEIRVLTTNKGMLEPNQIFERVDEHTKVISLCYVESTTGFKHDLEKIGDFCHDNHILLCVDGVQGIGVMPIDVKKMKIDFLAGNNYKWMLGYCGGGFAYVSKEIRASLRCSGAGFMSDTERTNTAKSILEMRDDAGRYEMGFPDVSAIYALGLSSKRYMELGKNNIEKYVLSLSDYLCERIAGIDGIECLYNFERKNRSSIVYIKIDKKYEILLEDMIHKDVIIDGSTDKDSGDFIARISIHYYNNKFDIDRLIQSVQIKEKEF